MFIGSTLPQKTEARKRPAAHPRARPLFRGVTVIRVMDVVLVVSRTNIVLLDIKTEAVLRDG